MLFVFLVVIDAIRIFPVAVDSARSVNCNNCNRSLAAIKGQHNMLFWCCCGVAFGRGLGFTDDVSRFNVHYYIFT